MAEHGSDYHHGHMDITEQQSTYALFGALTKWGSLATAVAILFPTLLFCTEAGFGGALAASVILIAAGVLLLRGDGGH
jgi:hypothetical protein